MAYPLWRSASLVSVLLLLAAPQVVAQQMVSVAGEEVNLRSGPGTQHPAEWILSQGYPLKVVGRRGKWLEVRDFENDKGWIYRPLTSSTLPTGTGVRVASALAKTVTLAPWPLT